MTLYSIFRDDGRYITFLGDFRGFADCIDTFHNHLKEETQSDVMYEVIRCSDQKQMAMRRTM